MAELVAAHAVDVTLAEADAEEVTAAVAANQLADTATLVPRTPEASYSLLTALGIDTSSTRSRRRVLPTEQIVRLALARRASLADAAIAAGGPMHSSVADMVAERARQIEKLRAAEGSAPAPSADLGPEAVAGLIEAYVQQARLPAAVAEGLIDLLARLLEAGEEGYVWMWGARELRWVETSHVSFLIPLQTGAGRA